MTEALRARAEDIRQQCIVGTFSHLEHDEWIEVCRDLLAAYDAVAGAGQERASQVSTRDEEIARLRTQHVIEWDRAEAAHVELARLRTDLAGSEATNAILHEELARLRAALVRIGDWRIHKAQEHVEALRRFARTKDDHDFIDRFSGWLLMVQEIVDTALTPPPGDA